MKWGKRSNKSNKTGWEHSPDLVYKEAIYIPKKQAVEFPLLESVRFFFEVNHTPQKSNIDIKNWYF